MTSPSARSETIGVDRAAAPVAVQAAAKAVAAREAGIGIPARDAGGASFRQSATPLSDSVRPSLRYAVLLALLFGAVPPVSMQAQSVATSVTLFGKVYDADSRQPIPFLTLQLETEKDQVFVAGRLTNEAGAFTFTGLKKGVYLLVGRSVGYAPLRQRVLIGELSAFLDLGTITMTRSAQALDRVAVTSSARGRWRT